MNDEPELSPRGLVVPWAFIARWIFRFLEVITMLALAGHIFITHAHMAETDNQQRKQDLRMERIERAIDACLSRQLECEAFHPNTGGKP